MLNKKSERYVWIPIKDMVDTTPYGRTTGV